MKNPMRPLLLGALVAIPCIFGCAKKEEPAAETPAVEETAPAAATSETPADSAAPMADSAAAKTDSAAAK